MKPCTWRHTEPSFGLRTRFSNGNEVEGRVCIGSRSARPAEVDAWCLGWSCFYLLTAQSLFATADPKEPDADWLTFRRGDVRAQEAQYRRGKRTWESGLCCARSGKRKNAPQKDFTPQNALSV